MNSTCYGTKSRYRSRHNNKESHNASKQYESNLTRFWKDCRERDIRKRRQQIASPIIPRSAHFQSTVTRLKRDAQILSQRFHKFNPSVSSTRPNNLSDDRTNRRQSLGSHQYINSFSNLPPSTSSRRLSAIHIPIPPTASSSKTNAQKSSRTRFFPNYERNEPSKLHPDRTQQSQRCPPSNPYYNKSTLYSKPTVKATHYLSSKMTRKHKENECPRTNRTKVLFPSSSSTMHSSDIKKEQSHHEMNGNENEKKPKVFLKQKQYPINSNTNFDGNFNGNLHQKQRYNVHRKYSQLQSVYHCFDSLQNDESKLKSKLQEKWHQLKQDVDRTFELYFDKKNKDIDSPSSSTVTQIESKEDLKNLKDPQNLKAFDPKSLNSTLSEQHVDCKGSKTKVETKKIKQKQCTSAIPDHGTGVITAKSTCTQIRDDDSDKTENGTHSLSAVHGVNSSSINSDSDSHSHSQRHNADGMNAPISSDREKKMKDHTESVPEEEVIESKDTSSPILEVPISMLMDEMMEDIDRKTNDRKNGKMEREQKEEESECHSDAHCTAYSYSVSHLQRSNEYWDFSVRQLKGKLQRMNVSVDQCIEKRDLIRKLKECNLDALSKEEEEMHSGSRSGSGSGFGSESRTTFGTGSGTGSATTDIPRCDSSKRRQSKSILYDEMILEDSRESRQEIMNRVDRWIKHWSHRRSFRQILNSILGFKVNDRQYVQRNLDYSAMMKVYKKAILIVHPDKHVHSPFETRYKAAEMFKVVTNLCDKYRNRRKHRPTN